MYKSRNKIVSKFVENKYRIEFKDKLTFLGLDYRDALLITLYFVGLVNSISKINMFKIDARTFC